MLLMFVDFFLLFKRSAQEQQQWNFFFFSFPLCKLTMRFLWRIKTQPRPNTQTLKSTNALAKRGKLIKSVGPTTTATITERRRRRRSQQHQPKGSKPASTRVYEVTITSRLQHAQHFHSFYFQILPHILNFK